MLRGRFGLRKSKPSACDRWGNREVSRIPIVGEPQIAYSPVDSSCCIPRLKGFPCPSEPPPPPTLLSPS